MKSLKHYIKNRKNYIIAYQRILADKGFLDRIPDRIYLKMIYKLKMGKLLNLKNPQTYNEKLNWLKIYDHNPLYTKLADKYEVKKYIASLTDESHIIPTYGVYNTFEDIDFDKLPNEFVLKCNHNSGGFIVVNDKTHFNKAEAQKKLSKLLRQNYYRGNRERVYKDIRPRIIAEKYMDSLGKPESIEYKLTCFNGKALLITICQGIAHDSFDKRFNNHYDRNLNPLHFNVFYKEAPIPPKIPKEINKIIEFSETVSKNIPCVRVDTYLIDGNIYFGEMTFYTRGGFCKFQPEKYDKILGDRIELPKIKK